MFSDITDPVLAGAIMSRAAFRQFAREQKYLTDHNKR